MQSKHLHSLSALDPLMQDKHQNLLNVKKAKRKLGLFIPLKLIQVQHLNTEVISITDEP
jgi:hypothetical protein